MRILIVEDDVTLIRAVQHALELEGHSVDVANDGESGASMITGRNDYDLLLLDLSLPKLDGSEVLKQAVMARRELRTLVLSGRNRIEDRVRALDDGADDFLVKPFALMELLARVRALVRRGGSKEKTTLRVADLVIDRLEGTVRRAGRMIELTPKEFALLELLAVHAGAAISRQIILREVWKIHPHKHSNIVDVYINYLRKKVDDGEFLKLVHTVRGVGYSLGEHAPEPVQHMESLGAPNLVPEVEGALHRAFPV